MKTPALLTALLAMSFAGPASADVIYDTIHSTNTPGATRIVNSGSFQQQTGTGTIGSGGPEAFSFYTPVATTIAQINLQLNTVASDLGSVLVYLVNDDGSGGGGSSPGKPTNNGLTGTAFAFTGATQLGTGILDSSLTTASAGQTVTVNTSQVISAGEHWIGLVNQIGGNNQTALARWINDNTAYTGGVGTSGQKDFYQPGSVPTTYFVGVESSGLNVWEATVITSTPEPASLAVLGLGLAGLGIARRRRTSK